MVDQDRARWSATQRPASRRRRPTTTCCGTTPSAGRAACRRSGPALVARTVIRMSFGLGLGVVDLADPVAVVVEHAGVEQLVLRVELAAPPVLDAQVLVRERPLRVVVAPPVPGVARHGVEVPPVLLDVLAVVGLGAGETEHALLEDRVATVPQRQAEAQALLHVAEAGHPVLAPAVGPRAGVVVGEVRPRITVGAVVLAHRAPLALADVGAPLVPLAGLAEAVLHLAELLDPRPFCARHHDLLSPRTRSTR